MPELTLVHASIERLILFPESVDVIVTSPPYKKGDGYHSELMPALGTLADRVLKPGGRLFLNFGQLREDFSRPFKAQLDVCTSAPRLRAGQTIAWIKSTVFEGSQRGHYQPLPGNKLLNYCWEPVFTFYRPPEGALDRLSIGVPFTDKSNTRRGTRGKNGDIHCAGDAWFIPYPTTGATHKKSTYKLRGAYSFPEELATRCLKLAGTGPGSVVLDPFSGGGATASAAKKLGADMIAADKFKRALSATRSAWNSA